MHTLKGDKILKNHTLIVGTCEYHFTGGGGDYPTFREYGDSQFALKIVLKECLAEKGSLLIECFESRE